MLQKGPLALVLSGTSPGFVLVSLAKTPARDVGDHMGRIREYFQISNHRLCFFVFFLFVFLRVIFPNFFVDISFRLDHNFNFSLLTKIYQTRDGVLN